jgi:hypothetical protein
MLLSDAAQIGFSSLWLPFCERVCQKTPRVKIAAKKSQQNTLARKIISPLSLPAGEKRISSSCGPPCCFFPKCIWQVPLKRSSSLELPLRANNSVRQPASQSVSPGLKFPQQLASVPPAESKSSIFGAWDLRSYEIQAAKLNLQRDTPTDGRAAPHPLCVRQNKAAPTALLRRLPFFSAACAPVFKSFLRSMNDCLFIRASASEACLTGLCATAQLGAKLLAARGVMKNGLALFPDHHR